MADFTQAKLNELREKAIAFIRRDCLEREYESLFIEMNGDNALFVVRLIHEPQTKVGMPSCVSVSKQGNCKEVIDIKTCNKLIRKFYLLRYGL